MMRARALLFALMLAGCAWPVAPYAGQVVDPQGAPLEGATVSSEHGAALTDARGRFSLADGRGELRITHAGYQPVTPDRRLSVIPMRPTGQPLRVVWDARWSPPGMAGLQEHLSGRGIRVQVVTAGPLPVEHEVVVLACPAWFRAEARAEYAALAARGVKLVVVGEWGGYDGLDLQAVNAVAGLAGVRFAAAAVRSYASGAPDDWLTLQALPAGRLTGELSKGVRCFTAGALELEAGAVPLLRTDEASMRIQAWGSGSQVLVAAGAAGRGTLVAVADASLWTDEAGPDGLPHWRTLDNARLAERLLAW